MTEEEAMNKWCPFARVILADCEDEKAEMEGNQPSFNRIHDGSKNQHIHLALNVCHLLAWRGGG